LSTVDNLTPTELLSSLGKMEEKSNSVAEIFKIGKLTGLTSGLLETCSSEVEGRTFLHVSNQYSSHFAESGDSGAAYLWRNPNNDRFVPIAIHCSHTIPLKTNNLPLVYCGCSIVECLQMFIMKSTKKSANAGAGDAAATNDGQVPDVDDILQWFKPYWPSCNSF
jgi:hypothetical protein